MGLTTSMANALTGMRVNQDALSVVSRNVANAGTPGYHRQALNVVDQWGSSAFLKTSVDRSFNESLQKYYTNQVSDTAYANTRTSFLNSMQTYFGKVGDTNSLDTLYGKFEQSMQNLTTSTDDFAARAQVVSDAQALATRLNNLTSSIQGLRQETEGQITSSVESINSALKSLEDVNTRLMSLGTESSTGAALLDQRDRLIAQISEQMDINVTYRQNGSVAIMTRSGIGLLDGQASTLSFQPAGGINANAQWSANASENGVGTLTLSTPGGMDVDLVRSQVLGSGQLAALIELRDKTLVDAQSQLDQIAAGIARALSSNKASGTAISTTGDGFEVDLTGMQSGNDFIVNYTDGGVAKSLRVVKVEDASKLPMDYTDSNGQRVVGLSFAGGVATVASDLTALGIGGLTFDNPSGDVLSVVDDGPGGVVDVKSLTAYTTVGANQDAGLGLSLFTDTGNTAFTGSLDGNPPQQQGFAGRISVNAAVLANSAILVQSGSTASLGDASRANHLLSQLKTMSFTGATATAKGAQNFKLSGNVSNLISQTLNYQGGVVASAIDNTTEREMALEALNERVKAEYGINTDDEMARLMELQNAYAANARVMSVIQELLDQMMQM